MKEKFEVEITLQGEARAKTRMFVTQSEFELLVNLSEEMNDPWQEAYSPSMYVRKIDQEN